MIDHNLTKTEQSIYSLVCALQCVHVCQLYELFEERNEASIDRAVSELVKRHRVWREDSYISAIPKPPIVFEKIDAIWVMMEHLKEDPDRMLIMQNAFLSKAPALYVYIKQETAYYTIFIKSTKELQGIIQLQERLDAYAGKSARATAKIIILAWDKELLNDLPQLSYQALKVTVKYASQLRHEKPNMEIGG